MAKLNRDDHKANDIGAKIVKWLLIGVGCVGTALLGKQIKDGNNNSEGDAESDNEFEENDY